MQTRDTLFPTNAADIRLKKKLCILNHEATSLSIPYYDGLSHAKSLGSPFVHIAHLVADAIELVVNIVSFAYFWNGEGAKGLGVQLASIVLDAVNCALSTLSLITRSISTLINGGYWGRPGVKFANEVPWIKKDIQSFKQELYRDVLPERISFFGIIDIDVKTNVNCFIDSISSSIEIPPQVLNLPDLINQENTYTFDNFKGILNSNTEEKTSFTEEACWTDGVRY